MAKFTYQITIDTAHEKDADLKIKSITTLVSRLSAKELEKLAYVIEHDPVKTALAKKYIGV